MHEKTPRPAKTEAPTSETRVPVDARLQSLRVALVYMFVSTAWILYSDARLSDLASAAREITQWQTFKGILFVLSTAALIFVLVWRQASLNGRLVAQLRESERFLNHVLDVSPAIILHLRLNNDLLEPIWISSNITKILGWSEKDAASAAWWHENVHPEDGAKCRANLGALFTTGHLVQKYRFRHKSGRLLWIAEELLLTDVTMQTVTGSWNDITDQQQAEERLRLDATVAENTREGVVITDLNGRILSVNRAFCTITGYSEEEVVGHNPSLLRSGRHDREFYKAMWDSLLAVGFWQGEIWNRQKCGAVYPQWLTINAALDDTGRATHYVAVLTDLSQMKEAEGRVDRLTHYDPLTDLPNRLLFQLRLEHTLQHAERDHQRVAVLLIDLDRFKTVNDGLGLNAGDEALVLTGQRLRTRLREGDTLARLGGDEFIVALEHVANEEAAAIVARDLMAAMAEPIQLAGGIDVYLSASIGITLYPADATTTEEMMRNADAAVADAKKQGGATYRFFAAHFTKVASERLALETELRHAVEREELVLHYQPLVAAATGRIVGAEALVRWQPPNRALVPPDQFIPIAEETGLIVRLGAWVLQTACTQAEAWRRRGIQLDTLAVNISAYQLHHDDIAATVRQALEMSGLPAARLELEICETAMLDLSPRILATLEEIKATGVRLAIDDFGTGYSSLSYIAELPVDKLKIDRSFVTGIPDNVKNTTITGAIIALGKSLGLEVLAEGVECETHRRFLIDHGCPTYQGFLMSPPLPPKDFAALYERTLTSKPQPA